MKKIIFGSLILIFSCVLAYAGGVTDTNNGNAGDIFVSNGVNNGANSVGTWTNPSSLPSLKGAKGDTGATGAQGLQGIQGIQGLQGVQGVKGDTGATGAQGIQGVAGKNGVDGKNGLNGTNGTNGKDGAVGAQGVAGTNGLNGADGKNGLNGAKGDKGDVGLKGDQGNIGVTGANGKDYDPTILNNQNDKINDMNKRVNQLEKTQGIVGAEVRVYDGKKWQVTTFVDYTTTRNTVDRAGIRFTYKVGQSYEDRRIDELEAKINSLQGKAQPKANVSSSEFYTQDGSIGIKERF